MEYLINKSTALIYQRFANIFKKTATYSLYGIM